MWRKREETVAQRRDALPQRPDAVVQAPGEVGAARRRGWHRPPPGLARHGPWYCEGTVLVEVSPSLGGSLELMHRPDARQYRETLKHAIRSVAGEVQPPR